MPSYDRQHAVVLGGSIAGLFTARVLSDHFANVTIVERDPVHDEPESRKGQPQTRHLHGALAPTLNFIRTYMPGVEQALVEGGALVGDFGEKVRWFHAGQYRVEGHHLGIEGIVQSRPFLEWHVRRYVTGLKNVRLLAETAAEALVTDAERMRVTGVRVTHRDRGSEEVLPADLVVDVTGRASCTSKWLQQLGYEAPEEEAVKVRVGYATRLYRRVVDPACPPQSIFITPKTPNGKRGAILFPIEGDRWIVTVGGWHGDHAPADADGFTEYVRTIGASDIYDVIVRAEPLSDVLLYKYPASRRLRYERLKRFPEGLLVLGDAVASLNPIYGQGMSSAAKQVEVLTDVLKRGSLQGAWRGFFRRTAQVINQPWRVSVGEDFRYPETEGKAPFALYPVNYYIHLVHQATYRDVVVYRQFVRVMHLLAPAASLMYPHIMLRVLRCALA
ncbi:MAG: hypothetical protein SF123_26330 [Chloroflexota bacterium]|nr:hypothetical protein [Chloroflexota bacterium]